MDDLSNYPQPQPNPDGHFIKEVDARLSAVHGHCRVTPTTFEPTWQVHHQRASLRLDADNAHVTLMAPGKQPDKRTLPRDAAQVASCINRWLMER